MRTTIAGLAIILTATLLVALPTVAATAESPGDHARLVIAVQEAAPDAVGALDRVLATVPAARLDRRIAQIGVAVVEVPVALRRSTVATLTAHPLVAAVEEDQTVDTATRSRRPNDPRYGDQWGLESMNLPAAWSRETGGASLAIIDTGVDADHEDLAAVTNGGYNAVDGSSRTDDADGHGTLIAGIAGALADNRVGVAGACWRCEIHPLRIFDDEGRGYASRLADAIIWSADRRISVVNMSLVVAEDNVALRRAVRYATDRGSLLVAAAGNEGQSRDLRWPAAYPEVLAVAGSDPQGSRYSWSNHGQWVDVTAPGCSTSTAIGGRYGSACGTSVATPHAAGVAALVRTRHPGASDLVTRWALVTSADGADLATSTHGAIDALAALEALDGSGGPATHRDVDRVGGSDRIGTAVALSEGAFEPAEVDAVVLARADDYPDALSGVPLAHHLGGPLLLNARGDLSPATRTELRRLSPERVVLLGGTAALSERVEHAVLAEGFAVDRIAGADRWETAASVAYALTGATPPTDDGDGGAHDDGADDEGGLLPWPFAAQGSDGETSAGLASIVASDAVYIVEGANPDTRRGWPDAVAAGWVAAREGSPLLLVGRDRLPAATREAISRLDASVAWIVGGEAAVSPTVRRELEDAGLEVRRLAGSDRFETSQRTASHASDLGHGDRGVMLATGLDFPDALAAGAAAAHLDHTLLLTHPRRLDRSPLTRRWIADRVDERPTITLVGGGAAISPGIERDASLLLEGW